MFLVKKIIKARTFSKRSRERRIQELEQDWQRIRSQADIVCRLRGIRWSISAKHWSTSSNSRSRNRTNNENSKYGDISRRSNIFVNQDSRITSFGFQIQ